MLYSPRPPQTYGPTGIALTQLGNLAEWNLLWLSHPDIDAKKPVDGPLVMAVFKTAAFVSEWKGASGISRQPLRGLLTHSSAAAFVGRVLQSNYTETPLYKLFGEQWKHNMLARVDPAPRLSTTQGNVVYAQFGRSRQEKQA